MTDRDSDVQRALVGTPEWTEFQRRKTAFEKRASRISYWIVSAGMLALFGYMALAYWWVTANGLGRAVSDGSLTFWMFFPGFVPMTAATWWWMRRHKRSLIELTPSWEEESGVTRLREELARRFEQREKERQWAREHPCEPIRNWAPSRRGRGEPDSRRGSW